MSDGLLKRNEDNPTIKYLNITVNESIIRRVLKNSYRGCMEETIDKFAELKKEARI